VSGSSELHAGGQTVVMITHDMALARIASRIVQIAGRRDRRRPARGGLSPAGVRVLMCFFWPRHAPSPTRRDRTPDHSA